MIKRSISTAALALLAVLGTAGSAMATTIDFESVVSGYLLVADLRSRSGQFPGRQRQLRGAKSNAGRAPQRAHADRYFQNPGSGSFQATFAGGVSSVSIDLGDYSPSDDDEGHLRAYDAANNLLASDFFLVPASGPGGTLTVSSITPIARVEWNETGSFAGAVSWDNLTYEAAAAHVPEPASLTLLGLGLAGMAGRRWRQRKRA